MKKFTAVTLCALGLGLSACAGGMPKNQTMYSMKQPVIENSNYAIDLNSYGGTLSQNEQARLARWFSDLNLRYGDRVAIDDPVSGGQKAIQQTIKNLANAHGVPVSEIAPVTEGYIAPGTIRVVVTRSSAAVPGCPDWDTRTDTNFKNGLSSNYGCSVNSNMAAMIADPQDLISGKGTNGTVNTIHSDKAVNSWREAAPTGESGLKDTGIDTGGSQ